MSCDRPRLVVIVGPTGAGKSALAMALAEEVGGEIVGADSQQVYVGMDIGTGKVSAQERARVPHHVIDVVRPDETMTAQRYVELADAAIADLHARAVPAIVAGGTGLYVRALLYGLFDGPPADAEIRARYAAEAEAAGSPRPVWERLHAIDPEAAQKIDPNDLVRATRALEVWELTGVTMSEHQRRHDHRTVAPRYEARLVGLAPQREALYARIDARVDAMIESGLVEEVAGLREAGYGPELRSQAAIGYAEVHRHLDEEIPRDEMIRLIKRNSRRYARRQRSWYRGDARVAWSLHPGDVDLGALQRYLAGTPT